MSRFVFTSHEIVISDRSVTVLTGTECSDLLYGCLRELPPTLTLGERTHYHHNTSNIWSIMDILYKLVLRIMDWRTDSILHDIERRLNEAVDMFNDEKYREAATALRALLNDVPSRWQRIYCHALLSPCLDDWYEGEVSTLHHVPC